MVFSFNYTAFSIKLSIENSLKGAMGKILGMIILIDGYNLLKQRDSGIYIEDNVREKLIRTLCVYHKRKGHSIMLIFDGGLHVWPTQEIKLGVIVIYVGYGKSADDYIKYYIAEHPKQDLLLVSSDRELGLWASKYNIASIDSMPFYGIMVNTMSHKDKQKHRQSSAVKTTSTENDFLDALMEDSSVHVVVKEDDKQFGAIKKWHAPKESKIDQLLRKKIEKL